MASQRAANQRTLVRQVLDDCLRRRAAGEELDNGTLIAAHPELMPALGRELALLPVMQRAVDRAARGPDGSGSSPPAALSSAPPEWLNGYRLLSEVHRGAQGVVYRGLQESTHRTVAVKVMREGPFASESERARFEREVEILARLRHPNIVTIHDKGVAAGATYFVMDYIDGPPLDSWILDFGLPILDCGASPAAPPARLDQSKTPNPKSKIDHILRLFAKICDAVHAAHLRGIIHRDLKPSNIRIDRDGEPQVLDFGLAKEISAAGAASMTADGQFVGSLPWASPEQVRGAEIDVRTDVYSLGVVLFQALTGAMPYDVRGPMGAVIERITSAPPTHPRTLRRELDPDLEVIVLRCLAKGPERRYQSAGELARDIRHLLAGEAIEARRDSAMYVLLKNARRYRWPLAAALAFVVLLAFFAGYAWIQSESHRHLAINEGLARQTAEAATGRERLARQAAETAEAQARTAREAERVQRESAESSARRARSVTAFLVDTLGLADPDITQAPDMSMKTMLDRAAAQVSGAFADHPDSEATVRLVIGRAYATLGELEAAREHLDRALEIRQTLLDSDAQSIYDVLWPYVQVLDELGARERSNRWSQLWALYPKLLQPENAELATVLTSWRGLMGEKYDGEKFQPLHDEFFRIAHATLGSDDPQWLPIADLLHLGGVNLALRDFPGPGRGLLREALTIERRFLPETHTRIIRTLGELVRTSIDAGWHEEAEALTRESIGLLRRALPDEHWYAAVYQARLGACLIGQGRFAEAEPLLLDNLARIEAARGTTNSFAREVVERLIDLYEAWSRPDAAESWRTSLAIRVVSSDQHSRPSSRLKRIFGPEHADLFRVLDRFNWSRLSPAGIEAFHELLPLRRQQLPDDDARAAVVAECLCAAAATLGDRDRYNDDTLAMMGEADRIARAADHLHPRKRAWIYWNLARQVEPRREYAELERLSRETLAILENQGDPTDSLLLNAQLGIGVALLGQGRPAEAEPLLRADFERRLKRNGAAHKETHDALIRLIAVYQTLGRPGDALNGAYSVARGRWLDWTEIKTLFAAHPALVKAMDDLRAMPASEADGIAAALRTLQNARKAAFDDRAPMALIYAGALHKFARGRSGWIYNSVWIPAHEEVHRIALAHLPADSESVGAVDWWLATLRNRCGDYVEAEALARESLRIAQLQYDRPPPLPQHESPVAQALIGQGRIAEGEQTLLAAFDALIGGGSVKEPSASECFACVMNLYATTDRHREAGLRAEPVLQRALERRDIFLLRKLSLHVVMQAGMSTELYELARQAAQMAGDADAADWRMPLQVAAADYRLTHFERALKSLEALDPIPSGNVLMHSAFLAMTRHYLGQAQSAREALDVARSRLRDHPEAVTVQERALVNEAASLVDSD